MLEELIKFYYPESEKLRQAILLKIELLEKKTYRPMREIMISLNVQENQARLSSIDAEIQSLRSQL